MRALRSVKVGKLEGERAEISHTAEARPRILYTQSAIIKFINIQFARVSPAPYERTPLVIYRVRC